MTPKKIQLRMSHTFIGKGQYYGQKCRIIQGVNNLYRVQVRFESGQIIGTRYEFLIPLENSEHLFLNRADVLEVVNYFRGKTQELKGFKTPQAEATAKAYTDAIQQVSKLLK